VQMAEGALSSSPESRVNKNLPFVVSAVGEPYIFALVEVDRTLADRIVSGKREQMSDVDKPSGAFNVDC
jgi:hypothetical protein